FLLSSPEAKACTPIPALGALFGGTSLLGGFLVGTKITWGLYGLLCAALLKSATFAVQLNLDKVKAFTAMIAANFVSTIPGLILAGVIGSGGLTTIGLFFLFPFGFAVGKYLRVREKMRIKPLVMGVFLCVAG